MVIDDILAKMAEGRWGMPVNWLSLHNDPQPFICGLLMKEMLELCLPSNALAHCLVSGVSHACWNVVRLCVVCVHNSQSSLLSQSGEV